MNKKYGKILLIMIIIVQLAVPVTLFVTKQVIKNNLQEYGKDIKVPVSSIYYDGTYVYVISEELSMLDCAHEYKYVTFNEGADGYHHGTRTEEKPSDGAYLKYRTYGDWSWYSIPYKNSGLFDEDHELYGEFCDIFDTEAEKENILNGRIEGPNTQAYMILRIYKGEYEIKEVNVGGMALKEFFNKTESGEIDASRFEYHYEYEDYDYYDEWDEEDYNYDEEITEPVANETT